MRLLKRDSSGKFSLTDYRPKNPPPYAILSHTWLANNSDEVTYSDIINGTGVSKPGYGKLVFCAEQAARDGLGHFWIDSCCIDRLNSTELNEAINSMFRWYEGSRRCYVYLADVPAPRRPGEGEEAEEHPGAEYYQQLMWKSCFRKSRWFTRGWTLQELLAPSQVEFFSRDGEQLGSKKSMEWLIHEITGIPIRALQGEHLARFKVEERLAWAEARETTREEDKYYSLLGIFGVFMPLIYGEGGSSALGRLRNKIDVKSRVAVQGGLGTEASRVDIQDGIVNVKPDHSDKEVGTPPQFRSEAGPEQLEQSALFKRILEDMFTISEKFKTMARRAHLRRYFLVYPVCLAVVAYLAIKLKTQSGANLPLVWNGTWPIFAIIGPIGAGKSSFIRTLGGRHMSTMKLPVIASTSSPCTKQILWYEATIDGSPSYLVDTPGFENEQHQNEVLGQIWASVKGNPLMRDRHLTGVISLHEITGNEFRPTMAVSMDELQNLLGHDDFYRLALVISKWPKKDAQMEHSNDAAERQQQNELIEDQWSDLIYAGAEVFYYNGTLPGATEIITRILNNRNKKRWSEARCCFQPPILPREAAIKLLRLGSEHSPATPPEVPKLPLALRMALDKRRDNWIARIVKPSSLAQITYIALLFLFAWYLYQTTIDMYSRFGGYSRIPVDLGVAMLAFCAVDGWLIYDVFNTAGNRSGAAVCVFCLTFIFLNVRRAFRELLLTSEMNLVVVNCVVLGSVIMYTIVDGMHGIS